VHPSNSSYLQLPWSTDGIIQIENFDHGGEGVAYHDLDTSNLGGAKYRQPLGVDLQPTTDAGGGYNLGYAKAGEWLQYTMDIAQGGTYFLDVRLAATSTGGKFHFELDGANITGTMSMANTGGYQVFKTITKSGVVLPAGRHVLRLVMETNNSGGSVGNFNWFRFRADAPVVLPPNAPTNLAAPPPTDTSVALSWTDTSDNETGFIVERKLPDGAWATLATLPANITTLTDTTVVGGKSYVYRVRAFNSGGESSNSNEAAVTIPVQPVYLSDLPWTSATSGYGPVERDMANGGSDSGDGGPITLNGIVYPKGLGVHAPSEVIYNLAGQYASFMSDVGVDDRQTTNGSVVFQVYADDALLFDSGVMGPTSATQSITVSVAGVQTLRLVVTDGGDDTSYDHADWAAARLMPATDPPPLPPPAAPATFTAVAISYAQIDLSWSDVADENGYIIERSTDGVSFSPLATPGANATSYSDTSAAASTQYTYRIRAMNAQGESVNASATATTPAQPPPPLPAAPTSLVAAAISSSRIDLVWSDNAGNESGYKIERSLDGISFAPLSTVAANITNYSDTSGLSAATQYFYRVRATNITGDSADSNIASATTAPESGLPAGWIAADIGPVGSAGSTTFASGVWTLNGAGTDIWGNADSFHVAYRTLTGDGTVIARVTSVQNTDLNAKAGLMIRDSLAPSAKQASIVMTPGAGIKFLRRTTTGGSTTATTASNLKAPYWLKLVRAGNTITSYYSANGTTWTQLGAQSITMGSTVYIGMVVTSKKAWTATATFDNLGTTGNT
jgi:regulation of enolase protein 1 (concanavalin A-like superfamily)